MKLMKPTTFLLLLFAAFATVSCSKDEETPPDPRAEFVGSFEMEDYEVNITFEVEDTMLVVTDQPEIIFMKNKNLDKDELEIKLNDFVEKTIARLFYRAPSYTYEVINDEVSVVQIADNDFSVEDFNSRIIVFTGTESVVLDFNFEGSGVVKEGELSMDFDLVLTESNTPPTSVTFSGTAKGGKD